MDIQIETRNVDLDPWWRTDIEGRVQELQAGRQDLIHARVTLTRHAHKRPEDSSEALIVVTLPGRTVTARKANDTFEEAIRDAFSTVDMELERYREKRDSREIRGPSVPLRGVVNRVLRDEGYGFILLDSGEEVYFHRNAVHDLRFEEMDDGLAVSLNTEMGEKGLQATTVNPLPPVEHYENKAGRLA